MSGPSAQGADSGGAAENRRYALARLGLACDAACRFCNVPVESGGPRTIPAAEAAALVEEASRSGRIELSGGEPTLRPDLEELVVLARARGASRIELQTNGISLASSGRAQALARAGLTDAFVGLHAHRAELHDFLVRRPGAFDACARSVALLADAGVRVVLNPVVTTVQMRWLGDYMRLARRLPISGVCLSVVQPHGRARHAEALVPRYGELSPHVERALDLADELGLRVINPYCGLPACVGGWYKRMERCVECCEAELGVRPDGMKFHPAECAGCPVFSSCGGIWRAYALIHGADGVAPPAGAGRRR